MCGLSGGVVVGLEAISSGDSPFFAFYNPQDLSTLQDTIKQLEHYIVQEGPFDVLMGFSEGAVLAATYLLTQKAGQVGSIKAAIFLSSAETADELEYMGIDPSKASIKIPTAHVWGSSDRKAPSGGKDLAALCEPIMCLTLVHDGGHELPKKEALTKAVHTIRRTLQNVN